jgi:hypothetical protein
LQAERGLRPTRLLDRIEALDRRVGELEQWDYC